MQAFNAAGGVFRLATDDVLQTSTGFGSSAQVADTTPPPAPSMSVTKNVNGYVSGNAAFVVGTAEANATVKIYTANGAEIGSTQANAQGVWSATTAPFADGLNYQIKSRAIDAAGNASAFSELLTFNVDARPPTLPTGTVATIPGGNQPLFRGTGEIGTTIHLVQGVTIIGETVVGAGGNWAINSNPLINGSYNVAVVATDRADNATANQNRLVFNVSNLDNVDGTSGSDKLNAPVANSAVNGMGGTDTAVYAGSKANFTVQQNVYGYTVTDVNNSASIDTLLNIERIQFSDAHMALDVNGVAGQAYRLYQAAFDRTPDLPGLGYWIKQMDNGLSLNTAASQFLSDKEATALYTTPNPADADAFFVRKLYTNVLHREIDQPGFDFWMSNLTQNKNTRAEILVLFSESPENQAQVIGSIENGFTYVPWA